MVGFGPNFQFRNQWYSVSNGVAARKREPHRGRTVGKRRRCQRWGGICLARFARARDAQHLETLRRHAGALRGVMQLRRGEVHALLGENGAGKSTLIKIMTGIQPPDAGEILLDGQEIHLASSQDAQRYGIAAMYQEPMIFPDLSVAENIFIGHRNRGKIVDRRKMEKEAREVLARLGVQIEVDEPARGLTLAEQQTVEIAKAISLDVRVLIMDEPTASLSAHEVRRLFRIIDNLRAQGVAILFISHRMDEVFENSDTVTILRDGLWISTRPRSELTPRMAIRDMVGRQVVEIFHRERRTPGDVRLKVDGLSKTGAFEDISFEIRAGEVLGFAGLVGARRTDVGLALFGIAPAEKGTDYARWPAGQCHQSAPGAGPWHRVQHGRPPPARAHHGPIHCQQHRPALVATLSGQVRSGQAGGRGARRRNLSHAAFDSGGIGGGADRVAFGRESAEGGHQQVAGDASQGADPRRADPRHRRWREGRSASTDRRACRARGWRSC